MVNRGGVSPACPAPGAGGSPPVDPRRLALSGDLDLLERLRQGGTLELATSIGVCQLEVDAGDGFNLNAWRQVPPGVNGATPEEDGRAWTPMATSSVESWHDARSWLVAQLARLMFVTSLTTKMSGTREAHLTGQSEPEPEGLPLIHGRPLILSGDLDLLDELRGSGTLELTAFVHGWQVEALVTQYGLELNVWRRRPTAGEDERVSLPAASSDVEWFDARPNVVQQIACRMLNESVSVRARTREGAPHTKAAP